ncbi:MAG: MarR family transcriptional regulator [Halioglobus sp.]
MIDLAHHEARYLALLNRQLMKQLEKELTPLELGPGNYLYLYSLSILDGRKQQELADTIGVDKAAATRALSRLERGGFVRRQSDPEDRRATRVYLTDKARQLRSQLEAAAAATTAILNGALDSNEQQELRRLLAKMAQPFMR